MKKVYSAEMVAHLWANRHATETRTPTNNFFTRENAIFSYGSHFAVAAFMDAPKAGERFILWNDASTSATTNRHRWHVWRALSRDQRDNLIKSPVCVTADLLRAPAILADQIVQAARGPLEKSANARANRPGYLRRASDYFDAARALYVYAGERKKAARVPTITPDADKKAVADLLRALAGVEYIASAEKSAESARVYLDSTRRKFSDLKNSDALALADSLVRSVRHFEAARDFYAKAGKKAPASVRQLETEAREMVRTLEPLAQIERDKITRGEIARALAALVRALADYSREKKSARMVAFYLSKARESGALMKWPDLVARLWPDEKTRAGIVAEWSRVKRRAEAVNESECTRAALAHLSEIVADYERLPVKNAPDSRYLKTRVSMWSDIPEYWRAKCAEIIERADFLAANHAERIRARNAEIIERWRAGENVRLPFDVPTMARIRGEMVETSRGATVPLSHAVRFVKIARRAASAGGMEWTDGNAPKIGHFTARKIGADLSAVIGCHTFDATEAARICELIEKTESVTA